MVAVPVVCSLNDTFCAKFSDVRFKRPTLGG